MTTLPRAQVLALIPLYAKISPSQPENEFTLPSAVDTTSESADFNFAESLIILTESKANALSARFRREADAYYLEAKRSMVSSISQVPMWIYGVMLVLGWNEIVAVIRSPVYFTFLLLAGAAAYITWHLNMVSLRGPQRSAFTRSLELTLFSLVFWLASCRPVPCWQSLEVSPTR